MRTILLLLLPALSFAQSPIKYIPTKDSVTVHLDTIVRVDSLTKDELYINAKLWFSDYFKSSKAVIDLDDKEAGIIIGKGSSQITINLWTGPFNTRCYFTTKISIKDHKYRLEVYDLYYKPDKGVWVGDFYQEPVETYPSTWFLPMGPENRKWREQYRDQTIQVLNDLFLSLSESMKNSSVARDW